MKNLQMITKTNHLLFHKQTIK